MGIKRLGLVTSTGQRVALNTTTLLINQNAHIQNDIYITWLVEKGGPRTWVYSMEVYGYKRGSSVYEYVGKGWTGDEGHLLQSSEEPAGYRYELPLKEAFAKCGMPQIDMIGWKTTYYDMFHIGLTIKPQDYPSAKKNESFDICYYPLAESGGQVGTVDSSTIGMSVNIPIQWKNPNMEAFCHSLVDTDGVERVKNPFNAGIPMSARYSEGSLYCTMPIGGWVSQPVFENGKTVKAVIALAGPGTSDSAVDVAQITLTAADQSLGTLTLTAVRNEEDGSATVTASHNTSLEINSYTFSVDGSTMPTDTITTTSNVATFKYAPPSRFDVVCRATNNTTHAVATARATVPPFGGGGSMLKITRADGTGSPVLGIFNVNVSESGEPRRKMVELAGRKKPSAFYGEGSERKFTVSWEIPPDGHTKLGGTQDSQVEKLRTMCEGDCIVDLPGGERLKATVGYPSISKQYGNKTLSVSVEIQEVQ